MKILNFPLNDLRNFNETFGKDVTFDNIEKHKKQGFTLFLSEKCILWKNQRVGQSNSPSLFRVKIFNERCQPKFHFHIKFVNSEFK